MTTTIKISKKRSNWQIKIGHDVHHLSYFESIIRPCLREIGVDPNRKDIVVSMRFENEEFDDYQILLEYQNHEKLGPLYKISDSRLGDHLLGLRGYPDPWMMNHLPTSERIYIKFG